MWIFWLRILIVVSILLLTHSLHCLKVKINFKRWIQMVILLVGWFVLWDAKLIVVRINRVASLILLHMLCLYFSAYLIINSLKVLIFFLNSAFQKPCSFWKPTSWLTKTTQVYNLSVLHSIIIIYLGQLFISLLLVLMKNKLSYMIKSLLQR